MKKAALLYGVSGGLLIVALRLIEYRFLVLQHSVAIYGVLIASLFAGLGLWLGLTLTRRAPAVAPQPLPPAPRPDAPFAADDAQVRALGITRRELEILALIARGMSNREIAGALFVSENTVKTHSSRLFEKLAVNRRMKAVQAGRALGLIP